MEADPKPKTDDWERNQLWNSLWPLRPEIEQLAAEQFESSERQQRLVTLLSRIVVAEMNFRARDEAAE